MRFADVSVVCWCLFPQTPFSLPRATMSKRKAASAELAGTDGAAAAPSPSPTVSGRSRRNNAAALDSPSPSAAAAAAESSVAAATAATSSSAAAGDEEMSDKPAVRRGGRQAVVSEIRPAQIEAQKRSATMVRN